jgi:hypothetical protein
MNLTLLLTLVLIILLVGILIWQYTINEQYDWVHGQKSYYAYEIPPNTVIPNSTLPDGTPVLICPSIQSIQDMKTTPDIILKHSLNTIPDTWEYPLLNSWFTIKTLILNRLPSVTDNTLLVSLEHLSDELLYIYGLLPNKSYTLSFDTLSIPVQSNSQGMILFGENPLPISALEKVKMSLKLLPENIPHKNEGNKINSIPKKDYTVSIDVGGVYVTIENTFQMSCDFNPHNKVTTIYGLYRTRDLIGRESLGKSSIPLTIGGQKFIVQNNSINNR